MSYAFRKQNLNNGKLKKMIEIFCLIWTVLFLGGIIFILKKGFSEIVTGLKSIDKRLKIIEDKVKKDNENKNDNNVT